MVISGWPRQPWRSSPGGRLSVQIVVVALGVLLTVVSGASMTDPQSAQPAAPASAPAGKGKLILYGDMTTFYGRGVPDNCVLKSRFKRGESMGFRMFAADPSTSEREASAQLVVHLTYGGVTRDIPMRYRATEAQPELQFWVAKWVVPQDAPIGIIRYTVTATDKYGRTGIFKPFENEQSQLTVVE
jgi:hypothetical protein